MIVGGAADWPGMQWDEDFLSREPWGNAKLGTPQVGLNMAYADSTCDFARKIEEGHKARDGAAYAPPKGHEDFLAACDAARGPGTPVGEVAEIVESALADMGEEADGVTRKMAAESLQGDPPERPLLRDFVRDIFSGKRRGDYALLDKELLDVHPELGFDHGVGAEGVPLEYLNSTDYLRSMGKNLNHGALSLLLGAKDSRCTVHLDGPGWTSWIAVFSGVKLFRVWASGVDIEDNFGGAVEKERGTTVFRAEMSGFDMVPPRIRERWGDRQFGGAGWDWDSHGSFADGGGGEAVPPHAPAECIVGPGDIALTFDSFHAALNLEPAAAVTGNSFNRWDAPAALWRAFLMADFGFIKAAWKAIRQTEPETLGPLLRSLAARARRAQALREGSAMADKYKEALRDLMGTAEKFHVRHPPPPPLRVPSAPPPPPTLLLSLTCSPGPRSRG